jgi:4-amino-4-deoxy-L-arabinose transferase-like glycosyltransferase
MSIAAFYFEWSSFLGPFHIVMLHFPIGFMAITVLLELWALRRPSDGARQAVDFTLGLTVLVSWLVSALGYFRASRGEYDPKVVYWHTVFGLAFAAVATLTWILHHRAVPRPERVGLQRSYRGLMGVSLVLLVLAAHEGGTLTHGARFLTAGAPPIVGQLLAQMEPGSAPEPTAATAPPRSVWQDQIEPILAKKYFSCHGPEKQKGKLRLDIRSAALAQGQSGEPAIVPGAPLKSRLVASVLLPTDHDDVMPPAGKEPLTPEEIVRLIHWIQSGAPYGAGAP